MRLKKFFKLIFLLSIVFLINNTNEVYANGAIGNGDSEGIESEINANASRYGISKNRTGYLTYLVNKDTGALTSDVWLIPYNNAPESSVEYSYLESRLGGIYGASINTYSGNISTATNNAFRNPPFEVSGYAAGTALKNALCQMNGDYAIVYDFIANVFGGDYRFQFKDNDERLIIEAVCWSSLVSPDSGNSDPTIYAYTAKNIASIANSYGYSWLSKHWKQRLPLCMYLESSDATITAPSVTSPPLTYDNIISQGYGMIIISPNGEAPKDKPDNPTPPADGVTDYLYADELNYYFPDMIPDDNAMRTKDTYTSSYTLDLGDWNSRSQTVDGFRNSKFVNNSWEITEESSSDLHEKYKGDDDSRGYLFLNGNTWLSPESDKVYSDLDAASTDKNLRDIAQVGWGYRYSRSLFGDKIVVCDYKGIGNTNKNFIEETLKLTVGHTASTGMNTGAVSVGREGLTESKKSSNYTFTGEVTEEYEKRRIKKEKYNHWYPVPGDDPNTAVVETSYQVCVEREKDVEVWEWKTLEHTASVSYKSFHGIFKYRPSNKFSGNSHDSGSCIYSSGGAARDVTSAIFTMETGTVSIIPEVTYKMYTSYGTDAVDVYCMGEKTRSTTATAITGYRVSIPGASMQGMTLVQAPLTGTKSLELVERFKTDADPNMQLTAQGSSFEMATTNKPRVEVYTFSLDVINKNISSTSVEFNPATEWGCVSSNVESIHTGFRDALLGNIVTEVQMERFNLVGSSMVRTGNSDSLSYDITDTIVTNDTTRWGKQIQLSIKDGAITSGKSEVITEIKNAYNVSEEVATQIWNSWGIESQILNMLESSTSVSNGSTNDWYDEETDSLAITIYKSTITFGNIILDDKMDFGSSANQNITSLAGRGGSGYQVRFYFSLGFNRSAITVGDVGISLADKLYLVDKNEIKGTRFIVSSMTSHDWLY